MTKHERNERDDRRTEAKSVTEDLLRLLWEVAALDDAGLDVFAKTAIAQARRLKRRVARWPGGYEPDLAASTLVERLSE